MNMLRRALLIAAVALLAVPAWGQDKPLDPARDKPEEVMLTFRFKDASFEAVLQYVSSVTKWIFVQEKKVTGTIDASSDTPVPVSKVIEFLNKALTKYSAVITNPFAPNLPGPGQALKVQDISDALKRNPEIYYGGDPLEIPISDQVRTQIITLKAVSVVEINKELGSLLSSAMGEGQVAFSTYSNSMVFTGRSDGIHRAARILRVLDVSTSGELRIVPYILKNADAVETAKMLNEVFKKETASNQQQGRGGMGGEIFRMMRGESGNTQGAGTRALAHEVVRIVAEPRTNAVVVSATEDNQKIVAGLIAKIDDKSAAAVKMKLYPLRYADATASAKLVNDIFQSNASSSAQQNRGGRGGSSGLPVWMGGGQQTAGSEPSGGAKDVRAIADIRTNSVLVAATEQNLSLVDRVMEEIDRQVNDILVVKMYKLQNADSVGMAAILTALFRPQVNATSGSGRGTNTQQGQGGGFMQRLTGSGGAGQSASSTLLPSQEVEITSDTRTNSVIVKASRDYIVIMDDVVKQLDADATETMATYVIPLKNADAANVALTLQNLLRGTGASATQSRTGQSQTTPFSGMQQSGQQGTGRGTSGVQGGTRGSGTSGSTGGTRGGGTRGNLGPLEGQEEPAPGPQEDEPRRAVEGQVDVQADASTNSLVLRTSPRNFQAIQTMLADLDRMRPQVLIKVLIADVTLDDRMQFGVEGFWENKFTTPHNDKATGRLASDFNLGTQGFSYLLTGDEFQATLNLFAQEGKLRVMATPRILVLDNQTASISVGKEVPIVVGSTINQLGNTVNQLDRQNVGVLLDVTPHVNPDGLVTLVVAPEISDVASDAESVVITPGTNTPTFNVNRASTTVAVRNGTTIVIGGLIRETTDETVEKIPILGDIPILGYLFSNTTKRKVKRELMIFLTPHVAYTAADLEEITELEKARLKLIDPREIEAESDKWLGRLRH